MKVKLIRYTDDPDYLVAMAARVCYDKEGDIDKIAETFTDAKVDEFLDKMLALPNHGTVYEHVSFTFAIEGVSRALSHQLVRHRIGCSFDQRSQRYCREDQFDFVMPSSIKDKDSYREFMAKIQEFYNKLVADGVPKEDARMVLPNACCTSLLMTMNLRSLNHFFNLRCCTRAQWEIRELANLMLEECRKVSPKLFSHSGASCEMLGYCPEGSMSCGKKPTLSTVLGVSSAEVK